MITYSGVHITKEFGAPTVRDIAVQSMRLPRFCAGGELIWPIGMHLLLVAALVPEELKVHALLHEAGEVAMNDIPRPLKTAEQKVLEYQLLLRTYRSLGLRFPNDEQLKAVHAADMRAANAEARHGAAPVSYMYLQPNIDMTDDEAYNAMSDLLSGWSYVHGFTPNGGPVRRLERALTEAIVRCQEISLVESYTSAS
jgi:hypothetical protein